MNSTAQRSCDESTFCRPPRGGVAPLPGFNINQFPFVRESVDLVTLQPAGASTLLVSNPRQALAETRIADEYRLRETGDRAFSRSSPGARQPVL